MAIFLVVSLLVYFKDDLSEEFWDGFWGFVADIIIFALDIFDNLSILIIVIASLYGYVSQFYQEWRARNDQRRLLEQAQRDIAMQ